MRIPKSLLAVLMALLSASVIAAPAVALQPGVSINPNSPASKEYSFPLDVLRASALGHAAPQGVAQPLFGVGIGAVTAGARSTGGGTSGASAPGAGKPGRHGATSRTGGHRRTAGYASHGSSGAVPPRELASLLRPKSPTTQVVLLALIVLLAGALLGVAIVAARRRG